MRRALFVGLTTLDIVYGVKGVPRFNSKNVVGDWLLLAGGPAANAAVACRALGGEATLLTVIGRHPLTRVILDDLRAQSVSVRDLAPEFAQPPAFASALISSGSGDRLVVSSGGLHLPQPDSDGGLIEEIRPDVILVDGHLMPLCIAAAREARRLGVPVVADAGAWKEGFETLLPLVDAAVCSEDFQPPGAASPEEALERVAGFGVPYVAVTRGERPILYRSPAASGEIPVEPIEAVDTLAAGDIFHGAFVQAWDLTAVGFAPALAFAAGVAGQSCRWFGARAWIERRG